MPTFEEEVMRRLDDINRKLDALKSAPAGAAASGPLRPAPAADLDGQYGDPEIRFDPKRWDGPSYVGCRYSQTEPAYLEMVAENCQWRANNPKPGKEQYAKNDLRDAARALGWAERLRRQGAGGDTGGSSYGSAPAQRGGYGGGYGRGTPAGGGGARPSGNGRSAGAMAPAPPVDAGGPPPPDDGGYPLNDDDIPF